jgi:repressor LexA
MSLTEKQHAFLGYLKEKLKADGKTPSLRESAADMGVSHTAIAQLLNQLERKGAIVREGHYSRTIQIVPHQDDHQQAYQTGQTGQSYGRELPIIGEITAGLPMYAQQEWEGSVTVDGKLFSGDNLFCLRIHGKSMQNAGILHGDLVICEPRQYAENGEIVAALVHGEEATVKRFQLHADHITLLPENPDFSPTHYPFNEIMIQGKVIGVIRTHMDAAAHKIR